MRGAQGHVCLLDTASNVLPRERYHQDRSANCRDGDVDTEDPVQKLELTPLQLLLSL